MFLIFYLTGLGLVAGNVAVKVGTLLNAYDMLVSAYSTHLDMTITAFTSSTNHEFESLDTVYRHIVALIDQKIEEALNYLDFETASKWNRDEVKIVAEHIKYPSETKVTTNIILTVAEDDNYSNRPIDTLIATSETSYPMPFLSSLTHNISSYFVPPMIGYKPALRKALSQFFHDAHLALSRDVRLQRFVEETSGQTVHVDNTFQYFRVYDKIMHNWDARAAVLSALGMDRTMEWPTEIWLLVGMDPHSAFFTTNDPTAASKHCHAKVDMSTAPQHVSIIIHSFVSAIMARINVVY